MFVVFRFYGVNLIRCSRFRNFYKSISYLSNEEVRNIKEKRINEISNAFECSFTTARLIVNRIDVYRLSREGFQQVTNFCQTYLKLSDIAEFPNIITVPTNVLNHRFQSLKEVGFPDVRGRNLLEFSKLMSERPRKLEKDGIHLQFEESLSQLFDTLCIPKDHVEKIQRKVLDLYAKNSELSTIRTRLTEDFLLWRLNCPKSKLDKMLKTNTLVLLQSVKEIEATINILTEGYGFSLTKIMHNGFLLTLNRRHLEDIIKSVPEILDIDIKIIADHNPEILREFSVSLMKNRDILQEFKFTGRQLLFYLKVLRLKPTVLRHRIESLLNLPDFALFRSSDLFLKVVYHQRNLHHRLKLLNDLELPFTIATLTCANTVFNRRLKQCHRQNYTKDVVHYLSELYQCSKAQVRRQLNNYPQFYSSSVLGAYKVIDFLTSKGVSKEQLWHGIGIIGYSPEIVQQYFVNIRHNPEFQPISDWVNHFNFVQLLIYAIERNLYSSRTFNDTENSTNDVPEDYDDSDIFDDEEEDNEISDAYKL